MGMMGQLQKLQEQLAIAQEQLAQENRFRFYRRCAVTIVMTGDQKCQSITVDPAVLEDNDVEMLQDLLLTAVNGALDKSRDLASQRLGPLGVACLS
jgi:DNA-binding YbaB/EbfC family protein